LLEFAFHFRLPKSKLKSAGAEEAKLALSSLSELRNENDLGEQIEFSKSLLDDIAAVLQLITLNQCVFLSVEDRATQLSFLLSSFHSSMNSVEFRQ
jgi:hypothetical protein